jgi:lytic murein transglycosylase
MIARGLIIGCLILAAGVAMAEIVIPEPEWEPDPVDTATSASFDTWLTAFRPRALDAGISRQALAALDDVTLLENVIERDRTQFEFSKPIWVYLETAVSEARIDNGRRALARHATLFDRIEAEYGVDRHIIAAIWGLESAYGAVRGETDTLSALATLAADGRRGAFFETQLIAALRILDNGDTTADRLRGSWAGAMGHTQFMPTSFEALAVDFDGDGRRDIWEDAPDDALASAANFLRNAGWKTGQPWGYEVRLPDGFDYTLADRRIRRDEGAWEALGIVRADGAPLPRHGRASVLLPAGAGGAAFIVYDNFAALERYNTADAYVVAVGHLADRLRGGGPIVSDWPYGDRALTFDERREMQRLLTGAGFNTLGVDGLIGPNTVNAIRAYQQSRGLIPDGYAPLSLLDRLRAGQ